jgi:predicted aspartyl protease
MNAMRMKASSDSSEIVRFAVSLILAGGLVTGYMSQRCFAWPTQGKELATFKITRYGDQIILPVNFNDKEYWFLLDTGSSYTIFDISFKNNLGKFQRSVKMKTPRKEVDAEIYNAPDAFLGQMNLKNCGQVVCLDIEKVGYSEGKKVSGLIGMNFLRHYLVHIDFDVDEIAFFEPVKGETLRWGQPCDITYNSGGLATIKGTVFFDIPAEFMIDTGFSSTGALKEETFKTILSQKKTDTIMSSFNTLGGIIKEKQARITDLTLGALHYRDLIFSESDTSVLGLGFLARHRVIFDFPNKRLYLEEGKDFRKRDEMDMSGLRILRTLDKTVVHSVEVNSPAYKAGIKAGDTIIKIGPKLEYQYDIQVLRNDLMVMDASEVNVTYQRNGQQKQASFKLKKKL